MENRASFPAIPTGTQVQSVFQEHISSGHAETTFGLPLLWCWLHQLPPSVERGRCVLGAGCLAGTSGQFPNERRGTEEDTALSPAAESLFVSLCFLPPLALKL